MYDEGDDDWRSGGSGRSSVSECSSLMEASQRFPGIGCLTPETGYAGSNHWQFRAACWRIWAVLEIERWWARVLLRR